jgi:hypothetical protein
MLGGCPQTGGYWNGKIIGAASDEAAFPAGKRNIGKVSGRKWKRADEDPGL